MAEKNTKHKATRIFDDTMLPVNRIPLNQSEKIESLIMPLLKKRLDELKIEKPHLFPKPKQEE